MLNRHVRYADLPFDSVTRNISLAIGHAQEFFRVADIHSSKTTDVRTFMSQNKSWHRARSSFVDRTTTEEDEDRLVYAASGLNKISRGTSCGVHTRSGRGKINDMRDWIL